MARPHILLIDDDPDVASILSPYLKREGFRLTVSRNGYDALRQFRRTPFDLVLLDVVLPETDGYSVCRELRSQGDTPVIFLSCRAEESDKIRGFDAGGDDYVTKPFSPRELVARVKARLRSRDARPPSRSSHVLRVGRLEIDTLLQRVTVDGRPVRLSAKEYRILCLLASRSGQTVGFRELCRDLWGRDTVRDLRTLTVHIRNLRKKLEPDPAHPEHIVTVRGTGYKLV